jgi:endonuclease/exonuclease/phosphatase family metal-dependent hydrolase
MIEIKPPDTSKDIVRISDMDLKIDYIFAQGDDNHSCGHIVDRRSNVRRSSDHMPMMLEVRY